MRSLDLIFVLFVFSIGRVQSVDYIDGTPPSRGYSQETHDRSLTSSSLQTLSAPPSGIPTAEPSKFPSASPIPRPTKSPVPKATRPSKIPTVSPTGIPSALPTKYPTLQPVLHRPTRGPITKTPTVYPTGHPSSSPTLYPSLSPVPRPSNPPRFKPSKAPVVALYPPTGVPTSNPTASPTMYPTTTPVARPTKPPVFKPSRLPVTATPLGTSTSSPIGIPTGCPTSASPTIWPSVVPSSPPSLLPTGDPTFIPTSKPSEPPSSSPTLGPTGHPTDTPTRHPTSMPSFQPTAPTGTPTLLPSSQPSVTVTPTAVPTSIYDTLAAASGLSTTDTIISVTLCGTAFICFLAIFTYYCFSCCQNYCSPLLACCKRSKTKDTSKHQDLDDVEYAGIVPLEDAYKLKGREAKKAVARMQRDIDEIYKYLSEQRIAVRPLLLEKKGLDVLLNEQKEKLARLLAKKEELLQQRAPLMEAVWESDADIIYESFNEGFTVNKNSLVDVLANRTKWQVDLIADVFEKKYNVPLQQQITSKLSSTMGSLVAGSNKYLCKLLIYRMLDQPQRDGAILDEYKSDLDVICEVFATRSSQELRMAIMHYDAANAKPFANMIQSRGFANYKKFMAALLELNREESLDGLPKDEALALANELYAAGKGKVMSADPEPFIRIFSRISPYQFDCINEVYRGKSLRDDIKKCFHGDFGNALLSRCSSKFLFLADRLDAAMKGGLKPDRDGICRILGCVTRKEGILLREAYDSGRFGRKLETALTTTVKKGHFLRYCLSVISSDKGGTVLDPALSPLGSSREEWEDQEEVLRDGDRYLQQAAQHYSQDNTRTLGHPALDEFDFPPWDSSTKKNVTEVEDLAELHQRFISAQHGVVRYKETLADDIFAKKDTNFALAKLCYETEAWIRIVNGHVKALSNCLPCTKI